MKASKKETESLVRIANSQLTKSESETVVLREQAKLLTVDAAIREVEHAQFEQDQKILIVQLQTEEATANKSNLRLEDDLKGFKTKAEKLNQAQTQLVEKQIQISQLTHDLSQSNRKRDSIANFKYTLTN